MADILITDIVAETCFIQGLVGILRWNQMNSLKAHLFKS